MTKLLSLLLVSVALLLPAAVTAQAPLPDPPEVAPVPGEEPVAVDDGALLSESEVQRLRVKAAEGDANSALRLAEHYVSGTARSPELEEYWVIIAAENGSHKAQYDLWQLYRNCADSSLRARAKFWLIKSAKGGYSLALQQLEREKNK